MGGVTLKAERISIAKGLDLVVANGPQAVGADRQDALLIRQVGPTQRLTGVTKAELASAILEAIRPPA